MENEGRDSKIKAIPFQMEKKLLKCTGNIIL